MNNLSTTGEKAMACRRVQVQYGRCSGFHPHRQRCDVTQRRRSL